MISTTHINTTTIANITKISFFWFLLLIFHTPECNAQKTDQLLLSNGDLVTGEIKKLDYGKVTFKTVASGTISVKWEHIVKMRSDKNFEIWLSKGRSYTGSFDTTGNKYEVRILSADTAWTLNMNRIVEFSQLRSRFWARLDGDIDIGYQYTKGSDVSQLNTSSWIEYKATSTLLRLSGSAIITSQQDRDDSRNENFTLNYRHLMDRNYATLAFTNLQRNTELGIDLRVSLGPGISKNWIRSNSQRFFTTIGALVNREKTTGEQEITVNYEGMMYLEYRVFRYRDPEMDITATYGLMPSFTVSGRYRWDFDTKIKYEIFSNFFIGATFYHSLDSKPPNSSNASVDWGVVTSIGYSF